MPVEKVKWRQTADAIFHAQNAHKASIRTSGTAPSASSAQVMPVEKVKWRQTADSFSQPAQNASQGSTPTLGTRPLPSSSQVTPIEKDEWDELVQQTEREIRALEGMENRLRAQLSVHRQDETDINDPPTEPLIGLDAPAAPRIPRIAREQRMDAKWASAQRDLVDPMESSRAYLDQVCRARPKTTAPYWVPVSAVDLSRLKLNVRESSLESLSSDPLEKHLKDLCRPW